MLIRAGMLSSSGVAVCTAASSFGDNLYRGLTIDTYQCVTATVAHCRLICCELRSASTAVILKNIAGILTLRAVYTTARQLLRRSLYISKAATRNRPPLPPITTPPDTDACRGWTPVGNRPHVLTIDPPHNIVSTHPSGLRKAPPLTPITTPTDTDDAQSTHTEVLAVESNSKEAGRQLLPIITPPGSDVLASSFKEQCWLSLGFFTMSLQASIQVGKLPGLHSRGMKHQEVCSAVHVSSLNADGRGQQHHRCARLFRVY